MADVLQQGELPSFQDFWLRKEEKLRDEVNALKVSRHSSLGFLTLNTVEMGDVGLNALASAAEEGGCFKNLKRLSLSCNGVTTDRGVLALSKSIAVGCMPKLGALNLRGTNVGESGGVAVALFSVLLAHCPGLRRITLPDKMEKDARAIIAGLLQNLDEDRMLKISVRYEIEESRNWESLDV